MLASFVIFSLLTTTCGQPCVNCVPQQRQYQYVVNVPMVPVQGVAVPSNNPQPCCNPAGQSATQVIWYSQGNGQQNSGMVSNFTAISTQGGYYQQVGETPVPQYVGGGNYISPSSPPPNQGGFTSPPPNYNPNVYLQGSTTPSPGFTGQTLSPSGQPFVPAGNQPYNQGVSGQQQGGTYNSANQGYLENQGGYGPISSQGGPNQQPNSQGNFYGQDANNPNYQGGQQGGYGPVTSQGGPNPQPNGQGAPLDYEQGPYNPQFNPQGNQGGSVGNNGMTVTSYQQGSSSGYSGAAVAGGVAAGAGAAAAGFPYATSSQYSTTTISPYSNTPGSTSPGGFQYSTQNPNQPNFSPSQGGYVSPYPTTGSQFPSSQQYPSSTQDPNFGLYGPSSQNPNQQGGYSTTGGSSFGPTTQAPFNEGQFSTQNQYNQGNAGFIPTSTANPNQYSPSSTPYGPTSSPYGSSTPYPQNTQGYTGPQGTSQGQYFGPSSTPNPMQTGNYPTRAQQDQASTTLPPYVNVAGGGQTQPTYNPSSPSSSGSSLLGQNSQGSFVGPTTGRPFYDPNTYSPLPGEQHGGGPGLYTSTGGYPVGGGASGGAGYTPQYDFEHNMNTQYGHYNSTSSTGPSRDAPQPTQPTRSAGSLHLVLLLAAISLLFF